PVAHFHDRDILEQVESRRRKIPAPAFTVQTGEISNGRIGEYLSGSDTVMDWASRRVLSWRVSNTMTTDFCIEAVQQEAIARYGAPEIFNTDQGSQFTSLEFTQLLKDHGIAISMDGKGCWRDNVFVERLWKSIKYEEVYLHAYETVSAAKSGIGRYLEFYNSRRPHSTLDGKTPDAIYFANLPALKQVA
ncbi:MAG TPA: DDE-type integrase/transposase/recombinase, partial [Noviherbaspirillum sp.]